MLVCCTGKLLSPASYEPCTQLVFLLQDIYLHENQILYQTLAYLNIMFAIFFFIEMLLKWFALGFKKYFTSFWTILDFIIVLVGAARGLCWKYCGYPLMQVEGCLNLCQNTDVHLRFKNDVSLPEMSPCWWKRDDSMCLYLMNHNNDINIICIYLCIHVYCVCFRLLLWTY